MSRDYAAAHLRIQNYRLLHTPGWVYPIVLHIHCLRVDGMRIWWYVTIPLVASRCWQVPLSSGSFKLISDLDHGLFVAEAWSAGLAGSGQRRSLSTKHLTSKQIMTKNVVNIVIHIREVLF